MPIHVGSGHTLGQTGGEEAHTLTSARCRRTTTSCNGLHSDRERSRRPDGDVLADARRNLYARRREPHDAAARHVTNAGGSQPHENMQPYLVLNFCIALQGIFPSQN